MEQFHQPLPGQAIEFLDGKCPIMVHVRCPEALHHEREVFLLRQGTVIVRIRGIEGAPSQPTA